jgi:hypothetical protein
MPNTSACTSLLLPAFLIIATLPIALLQKEWIVNALSRRFLSLKIL